MADTMYLYTVKAKLGQHGRSSEIPCQYGAASVPNPLPQTASNWQHTYPIKIKLENVTATYFSFLGFVSVGGSIILVGFLVHFT